MTDPLMSREEAAALWSQRTGRAVQPRSMRNILARYGIREHRGYLRHEVEAVEPLGQGRRTDLQRPEPQEG